MTSEMMQSFLIMGLMFAALYFVMIRPENKRKKQATEMRNAIAVGDVITTIGGITGTVCAVKDDAIVIETGADRVRIELMKWAIGSKGTQTEETAK